MLVPPGINYARHEYHVAGCKSNLHKLYVALTGYSDIHGQFPNVSGDQNSTRKVAGLFAPMLQDAGLINHEVSLNCPASNNRNRLQHNMRQLETMSEEEFEAVTPRLGGCYGYPLGYVRDGLIYGPRMERDRSDSLHPLMSDRPPSEIASGGLGNSANHGGGGQNVMFQDGSCRFYRTRNVGCDSDDIFVTRDGRVKASNDRRDAVLGASESRP
jgi:hypothetical protein